MGQGQQAAHPTLPARLRVDAAPLRREQVTLRPGEAPGPQHAHGQGADDVIPATAGNDLVAPFGLAPAGDLETASDRLLRERGVQRLPDQDGGARARGDPDHHP